MPLIASSYTATSVGGITEVFASASCFLRGTRIATPDGEVPVECLRPGDAVRTLSGAARRLRWVGVGRSVVLPGNRDLTSPVVVRRGALAEGVPCRDLYVTRGHALLVDGVLVPAGELVNHRSIAWVEEAQQVDYYHLELDSHDVLLADGAPAETYREDQEHPAFDNHATRPPLPLVEPCAPLLHDGAEVEAIWRRLSDRAGVPGGALTGDPGVFLLADRRRLDPVSVEGDAWRFVLPHRVGALRLVSRSGIPAQLGQGRDHRRLGVALRRLVLRQQGLALEIGHDEPRLSVGFHAAEAEHGHRWTDGEALLPPDLTAAMAAGGEITLHLSLLAGYPVAEPALALPPPAKTRRLALVG
ncbi:MAG: Hint domain-containing protein [Rhodospirillales bacterium]|nr:Hint domain-containing protein [Rhodospirillales bacterium]